jgi:hypothetical protein
MRPSIVGATLATAALFSIPAAHGQSQTAPLLATPGPRVCPPDVTNPPLPWNVTTRPLSEQLSESKDVICPPAGVDPLFAAKPPVTNDKTPVISPPGSPGGDPTVVPK